MLICLVFLGYIGMYEPMQIHVSLMNILSKPSAIRRRAIHMVSMVKCHVNFRNPEVHILVLS